MQPEQYPASADGQEYILTPSDYLSLAVRAVAHGRAVKLAVSPECGDDIDVLLDPAVTRELGYLLLAASDDADDADHEADR